MAENEENGQNEGLVTQKVLETLRNEDYVMLDGQPCVITFIDEPKEGEDGGSTIKVFGANVFTLKKHEAVLPANQILDCPLVVKSEGIALEVDSDENLVYKVDDDEKKTIEFGDGQGGWVDTISEALEEDKQVLVFLTTALGQTKLIDFKVV